MNWWRWCTSCVNRCRTYFKHHYLWYQSTVESRLKDTSLFQVCWFWWKGCLTSFTNKLSWALLIFINIVLVEHRIHTNDIEKYNVACVTHNYRDQLQKCIYYLIQVRCVWCKSFNCLRPIQFPLHELLMKCSCKIFITNALKIQYHPIQNNNLIYWKIVSVIHILYHAKACNKTYKTIYLI